MSVNTNSGRVGWDTPSFSVKGPLTTGNLWMPNFFGGSSLQWIGYKADGFQCHSLYVEANNMWSEAIHAAMGYGDVGNPPIWVWAALTATAPDAVPRMHFAPYSESGELTWIHADCDAAWSSRADSVNFYIGDPFGSAFRGNLAAIAAYEFAMTDAEVEALFARSSSELLAAGPSFMAHWPEADGVVWDDLTGGAEVIPGSETTGWSASVDPPGYDFSLAPARTGQPKIWNGSEWVNAPLKVWNGSAWVETPVKGHNGTDWVLSK